MATACRSCGKSISFAWDDDRSKWRPIESSSLAPEDVDFDGGVYFERWHRIHRCEVRVNKGAAAAYAALHLLPTAPPQVVHAAYRALSLIHHPDAGGDVERMKAINNARDEIESAARR